MRQHFPAAGVLSLTERLYRLLLFAYPPAHRREYGPLMAQAFRDLCRNSYQRGGVVGLGELWFRIVTDTVTSSIAEHLYALKGDSMMTQKQHGWAIASALLPLGLWLVLGLVNPGFAGLLFAPSSSQPIGWLMAVAIFALAGLAYFVQRKGFESANRRARVGSLVLLVLPAILLVLFGPAVIRLLNIGP